MELASGIGNQRNENHKYFCGVSCVGLRYDKCCTIQKRNIMIRNETKEEI
eukprot:TRINITY_DN2456_c0_g1_i1.p2 TRINITY_DN2456_c0_g1~~TRINITY_DN2456_c0_g1_i1.p2  ORF type:complete len:50 (-),score=10.91 TRINITY_DN2456_c0_g1_i1:211-360(-)